MGRNASEPWTSAGPRLGASIGLATRLLPHNLVLRENPEVVQEPRPTMSSSRPLGMSGSSSLPMSRGRWGINYRLMTQQRREPRSGSGPDWGSTG
jgi:hypothetical protein